MKDDKDNIQLSAVEDHDGILTIRGGGARRDWNGIHYKQGMSAKNVGSTKLSANIATIPPGGVAEPPKATGICPAYPGSVVLAVLITGLVVPNQLPRKFL